MRFSGWLNHVDQFDAELFRVSAMEGQCMDPQHRRLLEITYRCIQSMPQFNTNLQSGFYVGIQHMEYKQLIMRYMNGAGNSYASTGTSLSVASGRLSYMFGCTGPSMSVDTACSSALVAISLCVDYVKTKNVASVADSVSMILSCDTTVALQKSGMLAMDGRCKALDSSADGYGRSEACIASVLSTAHSSNCSVILAINVNQDGRSSSLTAPNGTAQHSLIRTNVINSGMSPSDLSNAILHGTGTALGDPIEIGALQRVFEKYSLPTISASKTNFGHAEPASGHIGCLAAEYISSKIENVPIQYLKSLNPHVSLGSRLAPFLTREKSGNPITGQNIATCVSAFAFQGTNANIIISADIQSRKMERELRSQVIYKRISLWVLPAHVSEHYKSLSCSAGIEIQISISDNALSMHSQHQINAEIILPFASLFVASVDCYAFLYQEKSARITNALAHQFTILNSLTENQLFVEISNDGMLAIRTIQNGGVQKAFSCTISYGYNSRIEPWRQVNLAARQIAEFKPNYTTRSCIGYIAPQQITDGGFASMPPQIDCSLQVCTGFSKSPGVLRYPTALEASLVSKHLNSIEWVHGAVDAQNFMEASDPVHCDYGATSTRQDPFKIQRMQFRPSSLPNDSNRCKKPDKKFYQIEYTVKESCSRLLSNDFIKDLAVVFQSKKDICRKYSLDRSSSSEISDLLTLVQIMKEEKNYECILMGRISRNLSSHYNSQTSTLPEISLIKSAAAEIGVNAFFNHQKDFAKKPMDLNRSMIQDDHDNVQIGMARCVARLKEEVLIETAARPNTIAIEWDIVGGTGALGSLISIWISENGRGCFKGIHMFGRSGYAGGEHPSLEFYSISKRDQTNHEESEQNYAAPKAVIFSSGVVHDSLLSRLAPFHVRSVVAPKSNGLRFLTEAYGMLPQKSTIIFSSIAASFVNIGQSNYSAANACLNEVCVENRYKGLDFLAVEWGPWSVGMAKRHLDAMRKQGMDIIYPQMGLEILMAIMGSQACLNNAVVGALVQQPTEINLNRDSPVEAPTVRISTKVVINKFSNSFILESVRGVVAGILGQKIEDDQGFMEAGLDSIGALKGKIALRLKKRLSLLLI